MQEEKITKLKLVPIKKESRLRQFGKKAVEYQRERQRTEPGRIKQRTELLRIKTKLQKAKTANLIARKKARQEEKELFTNGGLEIDIFTGKPIRSKKVRR